MEFVHGLPAARVELIRRVETLAASFAPRADQHDREATFPAEDFADLFREGLLAAALPEAMGGLGVGPLNADVYTLWMMTRALARVDLSLARCWEGHQNSLVIVHGLGTPEQQSRWLEGVLKRGEIWVAWSGEPTARAPGETQGVGSHIRSRRSRTPDRQLDGQGFGAFGLAFRPR